MSGTSRIRLKATDIDVLLKALRRLLEFCLEEGLECVDPPIATSRFLYSLGCNEYGVRRLWARIGGGVEAEVFRSRRSRFSIVLEAHRGMAYHDSLTSVPVDELDCRRLRERCAGTSNANKAYVFLSGGVEDNVLRVNIVRLLLLLERSARGRAFELIDAVRGLLWRRSGASEKLYRVIEEIVLGQEALLAVIEPDLHDILGSLLVHSPLLRKILGR